jgi:hypothetical protein
MKVQLEGPDRKRPTGEPMLRLEDNIKMYLTRNSMYVDMNLFGVWCGPVKDFSEHSKGPFSFYERRIISLSTK